MLLQNKSNQYPVAAPSSSITLGMTLFKWFIYLQPFSTVTVSQKLTIPSINSCFVFGFTSLLMYSLSSCHIFSIGFKSGDSAGVFHQLIPFSTMKSLAKCEVCLRSLSCMNLCDMGNFSWINGTRVASRICVNRNLSIIPSNTQMPVRPFLLIPAQTWTLTGL